MSEITIYIADDHPIVVDGLIEILKANRKIVVKAVAYDGESLLEMFRKSPADVVIVDIHMPKMNGVECTRAIKAFAPATKVIILTMYPEKVFTEQLVKAGVDGCLLKSRGSKDLLDAIDRVSSGKSYYDWISQFRSLPEQKEHRLSQRELEIIRLIVKGKTSGEVAEELFLSEETVKTHRKNIFKKLNIHHVSELITLAINNGF